MKLWIDDIRTCPEGWVWAKDSFAAICHVKKLMLKNHRFEAVSFDHDLGDDDTTRPVVLWMAEHEFWPEKVYVHTANPVGREFLEGIINHYGPGVSR
ncbi:hypothetical protein SEA_SUSHI23_185 [Streptomyces phage Sushi23]|uniref:Cyclic-phosphate processing Receiver domain-containing protein n=2 Tax=Samistivirus peebs TaxID=2560790 RepID=A0A222Z029_9CAUD|nr:hypothetical protein FDI38_gp118 [Streptomyces phage Peebs]ASR76576.1 hypothetical protein SEA_SUSHI23_185 [Streptomyces phage Sushi23]ASR77849.1 hypothetical protein SEA_PEEBS_183 [Streptomyces phage Peebs]